MVRVGARGGQKKIQWEVASIGGVVIKIVGKDDCTATSVGIVRGKRQAVKQMWQQEGESRIDIKIFYG